MLRAAILFFTLAVIGMLLGVYHVANVSAEVGQLILFAFGVLGVVSLLGYMVISVQREEYMPMNKQLARGQEGKIGYLILWLMGVPSSILLLIFLIRGH